jgi:hypothetical protein
VRLGLTLVDTGLWLSAGGSQVPGDPGGHAATGVKTLFPSTYCA